MKNIKKIMVFAVLMSTLAPSAQAFSWNFFKKSKPVVVNSTWNTFKKHIIANQRTYAYSAAALTGAALITASYVYGDSICSFFNKSYNKVLGLFGKDAKKNSKVDKTTTIKQSAPKETVEEKEKRAKLLDKIMYNQK